MSDIWKTAAKAGEIFAWQGVTKLVSIFAFAYAARVLGPEKFGISGIVLAIITQLAAASALLNQAYLSRRFRRMTSATSRQMMVVAATMGRLVLALVVGGGAVGAGIWLAPNSSWWLSIFCGLPLLVFVFAQPLWIFVARDESNLVWRATGIGSLVTSGILFSLRPGWAFTGFDVVAIVIGSIATCSVSWVLVRRQMRIVWKCRWRHLVYAARMIPRGGWLVVVYVFGNVYVYQDTLMIGIFASEQEAGSFARPAFWPSRFTTQSASSR